jgi:hypothetical protein
VRTRKELQSVFWRNGNENLVGAFVPIVGGIYTAGLLQYEKFDVNY